ncbi:glycosyltransferase [Microbacterium sp. PRF11]|uniref:glycosyltransferase n=1 Tax=Microbacterium sp. PRF11 TaxID=2962593 RepID=UPI002882000C|nr:glycosyltransferase [Microbacterium sp. PRF11]MDT0117733.1 glycosyltransferase [Microbacterium sp. PRF11]
MTEDFLVVVAQGTGSFDAERVRHLLKASGLSAKEVHLERSAGAVASMLATFKAVWNSQQKLIFMEGTGLRVGLPIIIARVLRGRRLKYVVSSGDAIDRFIRNRYGYIPGLIARCYETLLYRNAALFIGWTPYLVGRAIRMGAPTGLTIEGQAPQSVGDTVGPRRAEIRSRLGVKPNNLLVGVTGSINWSVRQSYAYGLELVESAALATRKDVQFIVVGSGSGRAKLIARAASNGAPVIFVERVPRQELLALMAALDVAVVAQTPDEVGLLRLTTKLPEYLAVGTPVIMPAMPGAFDYLPAGSDSPAILVPATHPGRREFWRRLALVIDELDRENLQKRSEAALSAAKRFGTHEAAGKLKRAVSMLTEEGQNGGF